MSATFVDSMERLDGPVRRKVTAQETMKCLDEVEAVMRSIEKLPGLMRQVKEHRAAHTPSKKTVKRKSRHRRRITRKAPKEEVTLSIAHNHDHVPSELHARTEYEHPEWCEDQDNGLKVTDSVLHHIDHMHDAVSALKRSVETDKSFIRKNLTTTPPRARVSQMKSLEATHEEQINRLAASVDAIAKSNESLRQVYKQYDVDQNGLISYANFSRGIRSAHPTLKLQEREIESLAETIDENHDGWISIPEAERFLERTSEQAGARDVAKAVMNRTSRRAPKKKQSATIHINRRIQGDNRSLMKSLRRQDKSRSGYLPVSEVRKVCERYGIEMSAAQKQAFQDEFVDHAEDTVLLSRKEGRVSLSRFEEKLHAGADAMGDKDALALREERLFERVARKFEAQDPYSRERVFAAMDTNGDQQLDRDELGAALRSLDVKVTDSEVDTVFNKLDVDGSGGIDLAEFAHGIATFNSLAQARRAVEMRESTMHHAQHFRASMVTKEDPAMHEMKMNARGMRKEVPIGYMTERRALERIRSVVADCGLDRVFNYFDANHDGRISSKELRGGLHQSGVFLSDRDFNAVLCTVDSNHDGVIDIREFKDAFEGYKTGNPKPSSAASGPRPLADFYTTQQSQTEAFNTHVGFKRKKRVLGAPATTLSTKMFGASSNVLEPLQPVTCSVEKHHLSSSRMPARTTAPAMQRRNRFSDSMRDLLSPASHQRASSAPAAARRSRQSDFNASSVFFGPAGSRGQESRARNMKRATPYTPRSRVPFAVEDSRPPPVPVTPTSMMATPIKPRAKSVMAPSPRGVPLREVLAAGAEP
mmetsp:Transcript_12396/g.37221  ORF Transcript_12396/g.37221 Transcript_12396/m.37221 type:complete len:817 (-) Transcript_12396:37-2487(-)